MGRTFRQRKLKLRNTTSVSLNSDLNFVRLTRWMHGKGWNKTTPLCLAKFTDTGRGLMAKRYIREEDVLVSIPMSLLITSATVAESTVGHHLISEQRHFLCQEVLAVFLVWERHLDNSSVWNDYIATLPRKFSVPHHVTRNHLQQFPWFLKDQALSALDLAENCFSNLKLCLADKKCNHCQLPVKDFFNWESFLWGWCCVNTRAVFIEPQYIVSDPLLIKDRNCLALAPYLDMFNHSNTAQVLVSLNSKSNSYEIKTLKPIKRYSEVFINYGPHANTKLFVEYGFVLPSNVHDIIPLGLNHLTIACKSAGIQIKQEFEKVKFFQRHNLITQLHISCSGLSWNCVTLLKILLSNTGDKKVWEQLCFMNCDGSLFNETKFLCVRNTIFNNVEADLMKSKNLLTNVCNELCCSEQFDTAIETCLILIEILVSVLVAAKHVK